MVHFGDPDLDHAADVLRRLGHDLRFANPLKLRLQLARFHICATAIQATTLQATPIGKATVAYPAIKRLLIHIFAL